MIRWRRVCITVSARATAELWMIKLLILIHNIEWMSWTFTYIYNNCLFVPINQMFFTHYYCCLPITWTIAVVSWTVCCCYVCNNFFMTVFQTLNGRRKQTVSIMAIGTGICIVITYKHHTWIVFIGCGTKQKSQFLKIGYILKNIRSS